MSPRKRVEQFAQTRAYEVMGRAGWLVKGVMFLLIGFICFKVLAGDTAEDPDMRGAIAMVAKEPGGLIILWLVAFGLFCYGFWRLIVAAIDTENVGNGARGLARRVSFAGIGGFYIFLGVLLLFHLVTGDPREAENGDASTWVTQLFELTIGPWLLGAAGIVVAGVGVYQAFRGLRPDYHEHWDQRRMSHFSKWVGRPLDRVGMPARGVAFVALGYFLVRSAWEEDPEEARDMGEAIAALAQEPALLAIVGGGFMLYGLHCMLNARYRTIGSDEKSEGEGST